MYICQAQAKVNLNLKIHGRREDGFHELSTCMAKIELADTVSLTPANRLSMSCNDPAVPTDSSNLVIKAAELFASTTGESVNFHIELEKHIPTGAGLGGGSSDAATTLSALNQLAKSPLNFDQLSALAAELGSDVPFFLGSNCAMCHGRGEIIAPCPHPFPGSKLLLLKPYFAVSTPQIFKNWQDAAELTDIDYSAQIIDSFHLFNDLERPAFAKFLFLAELKSWLQTQTETTAALMSGSGSTIFALLGPQVDPENLIERARSELDPTLWAWSGGFAD